MQDFDFGPTVMDELVDEQKKTNQLLAEILKKISELGRHKKKESE